MFKLKPVLIAVDVTTTGSYSINDFLFPFTLELSQAIVSKDKLDPIGPTTLFRRCGQDVGSGSQGPREGPKENGTAKIFFPACCRRNKRETAQDSNGKIVAKFIVKQKKQII